MHFSWLQNVTCAFNFNTVCSYCFVFEIMKSSVIPTHSKTHKFQFRLQDWTFRPCVVFPPSDWMFSFFGFAQWSFLQIISCYHHKMISVVYMRYVMYGVERITRNKFRLFHLIPLSVSPSLFVYLPSHSHSFAVLLTLTVIVK